MANHGIWIVERSRLFRQGLGMLIADSPFEVTLEAPHVGLIDADGVASQTPALILVAVETGLEQGNDEARELARLCEMPGDVPIVVLSDSFSLQLVAAMKAGASGYILKDITPEALVQSLHLILAGEKVLPSNLVTALLDNRDARFLQDEPQSVGAALSGQEEHILRGLAQGYPNKRIALDLNISESMVKLQVKKIFKKIRARNRTEAAIWARQNFRRSA